MTEAEALTRKIVEIFDVGAFDLIPSVIAPEYVDHQGLGEQEIRGPDGFRAVVEAARRDEGVHVTVEDLVAEEEKAAVRLRWSGVNQAGVVSRTAASSNIGARCSSDERNSVRMGAGGL